MNPRRRHYGTVNFNRICEVLRRVNSLYLWDKFLSTRWAKNNGPAILSRWQLPEKALKRLEKELGYKIRKGTFEELFGDFEIVVALNDPEASVRESNPPGRNEELQKIEAYFARRR